MWCMERIRFLNDAMMHRVRHRRSEVGFQEKGSSSYTWTVTTLLMRKRNYVQVAGWCPWEDKPLSRVNSRLGQMRSRLERSLAGTPITSRQLVESERQPDQRAVARSVRGWRPSAKASTH